MCVCIYIYIYTNLNLLLLRVSLFGYFLSTRCIDYNSGSFIINIISFIYIRVYTCIYTARGI